MVGGGSRTISRIRLMTGRDTVGSASAGCFMPGRVLPETVGLGSFDTDLFAGEDGIVIRKPDPDGVRYNGGIESLVLNLENFPWVVDAVFPSVALLGISGSLNLYARRREWLSAVEPLSAGDGTS